MSRIIVSTNDGEIIETINVVDEELEDPAQDDYIHTMIRDALITSARKQTRRNAAAESLLRTIVDACRPQHTKPPGEKVS